MKNNFSKKYNISLLFCCLFIFFHSFSFSQNSKPDSIITFLKTLREDTTKVNKLNDLFGEYEYADAKKAESFLNDALKLSQKLNFKKGLAFTYNNLGYLAEDHFNYTEALKNYQTSQKIREGINDQKGIAKEYGNIGTIFSYQGNYPEALKNFLASLKIRQAMGDKRAVAASYNNIGVTYYNQGNYKEALKNQFTALKICKEINSKQGLSDAYNNIGIVYSHMKEPDEALKNYFEALKINKELNNEIGLASCYNNIGLIYYYKADYPEALKNYSACLEIMEKKGEKAFIAGSHTNIGNVYTKQKNYAEAKIHLDLAKNLSKEIGNTEYLRDAYSGLVSLDSSKTAYKEAFDDHKLFIFYRDSLNSEETRRKSLQTQMNYDFEMKSAVADAEHKKELENQKSLSEEKSRKQKLVITFVGVGLLLVLIFAGFIFRSLRVTRRQKNIIELQKNVVVQQKNLVEEKQKEILDSINYAKRIQYALLAHDELLQQNLAEYFVLFKPKDIVSGDFYWAVNKDERFYLAVCDSTGHGVPGAFMSLLNTSFLNEAINEKNIKEPNKVLDHVSGRLIKNVSQDGARDGMDGALICFDKTKNTVTYAAAYNSPLQIRNNEVISLPCDKMPVGFSDKLNPFTLYTIDVQKGDLLYFYTDGYADQFGGPSGKKFKSKQLVEKLIALSTKEPQVQRNELLQLFNDWKGNMEQIDDVTIVGIKII